MSAADTWACEHCLEPLDDMDDFDGHQCDGTLLAGTSIKGRAPVGQSLPFLMFRQKPAPTAYRAPAWAYWGLR